MLDTRETFLLPSFRRTVVGTVWKLHLAEMQLECPGKNKLYQATQCFYTKSMRLAKML